MSFSLLHALIQLFSLCTHCCPRSHLPKAQQPYPPHDPTAWEGVPFTQSAYRRMHPPAAPAPPLVQRPPHARSKNAHELPFKHLHAEHKTYGAERASPRPFLVRRSHLYLPHGDNHLKHGPQVLTKPREITTLSGGTSHVPGIVANTRDRVSCWSPRSHQLLRFHHISHLKYDARALTIYAGLLSRCSTSAARDEPLTLI